MSDAETDEVDDFKTAPAWTSGTVRSVLRVWRPMPAAELRPGHRLVVDDGPFEIDEVRLSKNGVKVYGQTVPFGANAEDLPEPSRRRGLAFNGDESLAVLASRLTAGVLLDALRKLQSPDGKMAVAGDRAHVVFTLDGWFVDAAVDDT